MSLLATQNLSKRFGATVAVTDLSLTVNAGEVVGLIGPDGAGKTTTMRMLAGLMTPTTGSIMLLGRDLGSASADLKQRLGYMAQQYSLYGDLSVAENLRFFAGMFGVPKKVLKERQAQLLGMARLTEFLDRPAQALSGGMYKKLALSCALVHAPSLLLLDEPTNGVDPISRRELWAFLSEQVASGVGVLVSTPYMDEAERCARIGLLVDGKLVALDSPANLKRQFEATVLEFESEAALAELEALSAIEHVEQIYTVGKKLHLVTHAQHNVEASLQSFLIGRGAQKATVIAVPPSFEDIFMAMSGRRSGQGGA